MASSYFRWIKINVSLFLKLFLVTGLKIYEKTIIYKVLKIFLRALFKYFTSVCEMFINSRFLLLLRFITNVRFLLVL